MTQSSDTTMGVEKLLEEILNEVESLFPQFDVERELLASSAWENEAGVMDLIGDLVKQTDVAVPAIIGHLHAQLADKSAERRVRGARALFWLSDFIRAADGPSSEWMSSFVAKSIANQSEDLRTRCYLIRFAGFTELTPHEIVPAIKRLLSHKNMPIRRAAIIALGEYGLAAKETWPLMVDRLRNETTVEVWQAFSRFVEELCLGLDADELDEVVEHLAVRLVPLLAQKIREANVNVAIAAVDMVSHFGEHAALATEALSEAILGNDVELSIAATCALRSIGSKARAALPLLIKARHRELVGFHADEALARIDPIAYAVLELNSAVEAYSDDKFARVSPAHLVEKNKIQIGTAPPIVLADFEGMVVKALVDLEAASQSELANRSGVNQPGRVLGRIVSKHPQLANHITLPGGKGRGGYRTTIKQP